MATTVTILTPAHLMAITGLTTLQAACLSALALGSMVSMDRDSMIAISIATVSMATADFMAAASLADRVTDVNFTGVPISDLEEKAGHIAADAAVDFAEIAGMAADSVLVAAFAVAADSMKAAGSMAAVVKHFRIIQEWLGLRLQPFLLVRLL